METQTSSWDIPTDRSRLELQAITVIKSDNSADKDKQKLKEITTTNYKLWIAVKNKKQKIFQVNNVYTVSKKRKDKKTYRTQKYLSLFKLSTGNKPWTYCGACST